MVRVVSVRGLRGEARGGVVYVGRPFAGWPGHPLGNPFRVRAGDPPGTCLAKYREWLLARPMLGADLAALWGATRGGELPLGCWCTSATAGDGSPVVCHAQILAEMLAEQFTEAEA